MTEEELCSHCGIGRVRPMHFNMEEALVICDNHECDHLLTTIPSEKIIKHTLQAPTMPFQIGVHERYGSSSNSSSSGFVSEIRSPLLSPAPSTTTSLTDKEVELLFNPASCIQKEQPEKNKLLLEGNPPVEKLQGSKVSSKICKSERCNDSNASSIEISDSKLVDGSNCHFVKNHSSNTNKNHKNHEFLKALDKLELQEIENNANIGDSKSMLKMTSNSCRKNNEYSSLVIPSYSSAFSQVSPHRDIDYSKNSFNKKKVYIKQEVSNEAIDSYPHSSKTFFSPVSSDDSGYTEEILNKQEIKKLLENKQNNLSNDLTRVFLGRTNPSSHYENVVKDLIKPSFPLADINISVHPAVIDYDTKCISAVDGNSNNEDSLTSGDASILLPSASRNRLQNVSHSESQIHNKDSNTEKSKDLDESLINHLDEILENDISHTEPETLKVSTCQNDMVGNCSENRDFTSNEHSSQEFNSEIALSNINTAETPIDSHNIEFNSNTNLPNQVSVLMNAASPFNYSDKGSAACSPISFDQPSENDNFSDRASVVSNASDNSLSSYGSFGQHHSYVTDQDSSSTIGKSDGKFDNFPNRKKNKGRGRGRGRKNIVRENNLRNFDGLRGPSAVVPSKRSKILNMPEPVRVSQRSKQNIEVQATKSVPHITEEKIEMNLPSTSSSVRSVRRGLASLVQSSDYGSANNLINSTAHRLSAMSYRSTPSVWHRLSL